MLVLPTDRMRCEDDVVAFIAERPRMIRVLRAVAGLDLPDCWVGAGFIRNALWDALHGLSSPPDDRDVDVIFFDRSDARAEHDARIEDALASACPDVPWSVKNQARMHERNGDSPYADSFDALCHWPERCTAIAARLSAERIELLAPFGLGDLVHMIVRPTPAFATKMPVYRERLRAKNWGARWPRLQILGLA